MVPFLKEPTGTQAITTQGCTGAGEVRSPGSAGGAAAPAGGEEGLGKLPTPKQFLN